MLIAKEKKKTNIAEYVLYLWQTEDLIRANGLSLSEIDHNIVQKYEQPPEVKEQIKQWYAGLIEMMKEEGIQEKGHLQFVKNVMAELGDLHRRLLNAPEQNEYRNYYQKAVPVIAQFQQKLQGTVSGEMETCFSALYGVLLLRLQQREITKETADGVDKISQLLALLAKRYHQREKGELKNTALY